MIPRDTLVWYDNGMTRVLARVVMVHGDDLYTIAIKHEQTRLANGAQLTRLTPDEEQQQ